MTLPLILCGIIPKGYRTGACHDDELSVVTHTISAIGRTSGWPVTHQDQIAALLNQLRKQREGMFHGSTIGELTGLVDKVMRTQETTSCKFKSDQS